MEKSSIESTYGWTLARFCLYFSRIASCLAFSSGDKSFILCSIEKVNSSLKSEKAVCTHFRSEFSIEDFFNVCFIEADLVKDFTFAPMFKRVFHIYIFIKGIKIGRNSTKAMRSLSIGFIQFDMLGVPR